MSRYQSTDCPLVSICTTYYNGARFINRAIESCLNQTYKNIELVIVDDASTDGSVRVVQKYSEYDRRIKYIRNDTRIGLSESFLVMAQHADGDFGMVLGADDWLSRDYIENGVSTLLSHPDAAGIIPDLTTLFEVGDTNIFTWGGRTHFTKKIKRKSAEWFVKRMYRQNSHLYVSGYAFVRRADLLNAMQFFNDNYYHNPTPLISAELRGFFRRALGIDVMMFTKILTGYRYFLFNPSMNYIKIEHSSNQRFDLEERGLAWVALDSYYYLLMNKFVLEHLWPRRYREMKIYYGAALCSSIIIGFAKASFKSSFFNFKESKRHFANFFNQLSIGERILSMTYALPMLIIRSFYFAKRKITGKKEQIVMKPDFSLTNFLNSDRHFSIE